MVVKKRLTLARSKDNLASPTFVFCRRCISCKLRWRLPERSKVNTLKFSWSTNCTLTQGAHQYCTVICPVLWVIKDIPHSAHSSQVVHAFCTGEHSARGSILHGGAFFTGGHSARGSILHGGAFYTGEHSARGAFCTWEDCARGASACTGEHSTRGASARGEHSARGSISTGGAFCSGDRLQCACAEWWEELVAACTCRISRL